MADGQGGTAQGTLGTVRNATLLLDILSDGPAYRQISELAEASGLSLPTVHRLLRSLVVAGLVEQEDRTSRYGLGPELTRLSQRYLARLPVLGALDPYLVSLRDHVGSTVHVAILVRGTAVYVDRVDGSDSGLYRGAQHTEPAFATAAGRVLVSRSDVNNWKMARERVDEIAAKEAEAELPGWRAEQYLTVSESRSSGQQEVAVPIIDGAGHAPAALSINMPADAAQSEVDGVVNKLLEVAKAAGRTLGHG